MEPDLRRHIIALLELGIKFNEHAGLTEERLLELERDQNLSHDKMREAIRYLRETGALKTILDDPKRPYEIGQAFVTDVGKMRYHQLVEESASKAKVPTSKRIFIVHGKDEENRDLLKRILIEWGLDPIILDEKPIKGKTLIERLIEYTSQVGFAFIIMTPDDIGMEKSSIGRFVDGVTEYWPEPSMGFTAVTTGSNTARLYPTGLKQAIEKAIPQHFELRARQNILFEYGLCVGRLGREKVCLLLKGDVVFPADIRGIVYIPFKEKVTDTDCRGKIRKELEEFGYELKNQRIIWNEPLSVSLDELHELAEVPDQQLPPELVAEKIRLSENPNVVSKVRIFRRTDGTFVIKWDEM
jgi:predicted nucleotide-binding protein